MPNIKYKHHILLYVINPLLSKLCDKLNCKSFKYIFIIIFSFFFINLFIFLFPKIGNSYLNQSKNNSYFGNIFIDKKYLENAKYLIDKNKIIELKQGKYKNKENDYYHSVELEFVCFGDLNYDNKDDVAIIISENMGGSGTFFSLHVILNNSQLSDVIDITNLSYPLSFDIAIKFLIIRDNTIVINMMTHRPDDSKAKPTLKKVEQYKIEGNRIVKLKLHSQEIEKILYELIKLRAKIDVGIDYKNYNTLIGNLKYQYDLYKEFCDKQMGDFIIDEHINKALEKYQIASKIWSYKFQPINGLRRDSVLKNIHEKYGLIEVNSILGRTIRKIYPEAESIEGYFVIQILLSKLWEDASKDIDIAIRLIK